MWWSSDRLVGEERVVLRGPHGPLQGFGFYMEYSGKSLENLEFGDVSVLSF